MTKQLETKQLEHAQDLAQEYAHATSGMVGTSCGGALNALRILADDKSSTLAIARLHRLTAFARRAQDDLQEGEKSFQANDVENANRQWANALVLMDALSVDSADITNSKIVKTATKLQKSGKTG